MDKTKERADKIQEILQRAKQRKVQESQEDQEINDEELK